MLDGDLHGGRLSAIGRGGASGAAPDADGACDQDDAPGEADEVADGVADGGDGKAAVALARHALEQRIGQGEAFARAERR